MTKREANKKVSRKFPQLSALMLTDAVLDETVFRGRAKRKAQQRQGIGRPLDGVRLCWDSSSAMMWHLCWEAGVAIGSESDMVPVEKHPRSQREGLYTSRLRHGHCCDEIPADERRRMGGG